MSISKIGQKFVAQTDFIDEDYAQNGIKTHFLSVLLNVNFIEA